MAKYQVLYWKDIPAQVKAFEGARGISRALPERYQIHIDRVAMQSGLYGSDAYLEQWRWGPKTERDGNPTDVLEAVCQELMAQWDDKIS